MSVEKDVRYELLARLCPNTTGGWLVFKKICPCFGAFTVSNPYHYVKYITEVAQHKRNPKTVCASFVHQALLLWNEHFGIDTALRMKYKMIRIW